MNNLVKIAGGLIIVGGGIYAYNALKTKNTAESLVPRFTGITKPRFLDGKLKFSIKAEVTNPTSNPLNIEQIVGKLDFINGNNLANTVSFNPITIDPKKTTSVKIPVESEKIAIASITNIISLITGGSSGYNKAVFNASVIVNGITAPIKEIIKLV